MPDFGPLTCAGCALLCDDVTVEVSDGSVRLRPDCRLGASWFSERLARRVEGPSATIDGEPADVETALTRAAGLLRDARRPLLRGFGGATVEDVRAALALGDRLGALVINGAVSGPWPGAPAVPLRGASTATLGEIRDRSGVIVVWREDPETSHPRLLDRLGLGAGGERTLVVIDDADTATAERAGVRLRWPRDRDLEALTILHALQRDLAVQDGELERPLTRLLERVRAVPHVAFIYGAGLTAGAGGQRRALALHDLVRALCRERHAVTLELPAAPGAKTADDVLAWQSGYGGNVDFASGHPELVTATVPPDDVDVTLLVEPGSGADAQIVLGSRPAGPGTDVWIRTAAPGVEASGTAHRLDGVPLALQAPWAGDIPTSTGLLTALLTEIEA